jgi:hypothetical protein
MPEMAAVSARDEDVAAKSRRGVYTGAMPRHNACARAWPGHEVSGRDMSTTEVSTTEVSTAEVSTTAAMTTAVSTAAVSRGSIGSKR